MKHEITHEGTLVQPTLAEHWAGYFREKRLDYMARYQSARTWPDRRSARSFVLHYGRLIRKIERRGVAA